MKQKLPKMIVPILMIFCLVSCGSEKEGSGPRTVYTMVVGGPAEGSQRTFSGVSQAQAEIVLSFRVSGQIIDLPIRVGDQITVGQVLAKLDPKDAELVVSQKRAALVDAQAQLQQAKSDYERVRKLYEAGSTSAAELDASLAKYRSARANTDAAGKDLALSQQQLEYTSLTAEVPGEITSKNSEVFETVTAGQEVARMVSGEEIRVLIGVPEGLVSYFENGMMAQIKFETIPDKIFDARVIEVGRTPDETTTYPVKLLLITTDPRVRPGMVAEVTFTFTDGEKGDRLMVPPQVVVGEGEERYVWLVDPQTDKVKKQPVKVGMLESKGLVILSGLESGQTIVTRGVHRLEEGMKVKPLLDRGQNP